MSECRSVAILINDQALAAALAQRLQTRECESFVAATSDDLYECIGNVDFDVLVIEDRQRGFLSGTEIIGRLNEELVRPVTILLATPSAEIQQSAGKLGISQVVSPDGGIETIEKSICTASAKSVANQGLPPTAARRLVREGDCIQPLGQLVIKLAEALREGNIDIDALAREIAGDAKATADVLQFANSSAMGRVQRTASLPEAVRFLGAPRTASLILAKTIASPQRGFMSALPPDLRAQYSYRSLLTAGIAAAFASNLEEISAETAYVLGLMQDLGVQVLAHHYGQRYTELLKRVHNISHLQLENEERNSFGLCHADVSAALLEKWGLPGYLITIVGWHHLLELPASSTPLEQAFVRVMRIGESVANLADRRNPQQKIGLKRLLAQYGPQRTELCRTTLDNGVERAREASLVMRLPFPSDRTLTSLFDDLLGIETDSAAIEPAAIPDEEPTTEATAEQTEAEPLAGMHFVTNELHDEQTSILVIEDDPSIVKMITRFLKPLRIEVRNCTGLTEASVLAPRVNAILADVHLGRENGIEIVRALRARGYTGSVVMMSADAQRSTVAKSIEVGINSYLIKPFGEAQLLEKLSKCPNLLPTSSVTT